MRKNYYGGLGGERGGRKYRKEKLGVRYAVKCLQGKGSQIKSPERKKGRKKKFGLQLSHKGERE